MEKDGYKEVDDDDCYNVVEIMIFFLSDLKMKIRFFVLQIFSCEASS